MLDRLERVLQKSIDFFSDKAYISRTPMVLQECEF